VREGDPKAAADQGRVTVEFRGVGAWGALWARACSVHDRSADISHSKGWCERARSSGATLKWHGYFVTSPYTYLTHRLAAEKAERSERLGTRQAMGPPHRDYNLQMIRFSALFALAAVAAAQEPIAPRSAFEPPAAKAAASLAASTKDSPSDLLTTARRRILTRPLLTRKPSRSLAGWSARRGL